MVKKRYLLLLLISILCAVCACGVEEPEKEVKTLSVSEEIAAGVSEDIVPEEAYSYSAVSFTAPEGMVADEGNTVDQGFYFASDVGDLSYIAYSKTETDKRADYDALTKQAYQESLEKQLGAPATVSSFEREEHDGYIQIKAEVAYESSENKYNLRQYIFVTDHYLFCVDYCLGGTTNLLESYIESEKTLALESVASSVSVNQ